VASRLHSPRDLSLSQKWLHSLLAVVALATALFTSSRGHSQEALDAVESATETPTVAAPELSHEAKRYLARQETQSISRRVSPPSGQITPETTETPQGQRSQAHLFCQGSQPLFSLMIVAEQVLFELPGLTRLAMPAPTARNSSNSFESVTWFQSQNEFGERIDAMVIDTKSSGGVSCHDGMSDQAYPYSVFLSTPVGVFDGCCLITRESTDSIE